MSDESKIIIPEAKEVTAPRAHTISKMTVKVDANEQQILKKQSSCCSFFVGPGGQATPSIGEPQPFAMAMFVAVAKELDELKKEIAELKEKKPYPNVDDMFFKT